MSSCVKGSHPHEVRSWAGILPGDSLTCNMQKGAELVETGIPRASCVGEYFPKDDNRCPPLSLSATVRLMDAITGATRAFARASDTGRKGNWFRSPRRHDCARSRLSYYPVVLTFGSLYTGDRHELPSSSYRHVLLAGRIQIQPWDVFGLVPHALFHR